MSNIDEARRKALDTAEEVMELRPNCRPCFVILQPDENGAHCDLVALCETDDLLVAATYLLSIARSRLDPRCLSDAADRKAIDAALAAMPCGPYHEAESRH